MGGKTEELNDREQKGKTNNEMMALNSNMPDKHTN